MDFFVVFLLFILILAAFAILCIKEDEYHFHIIEVVLTKKGFKIVEHARFKCITEACKHCESFRTANPDGEFLVEAFKV